MFAVSTIGLILTAANHDFKPSLATRRFHQNGYRSEDTLFFAGQAKPRARHRPDPREIGEFIYLTDILFRLTRLIGSID